MVTNTDLKQLLVSLLVYQLLRKYFIDEHIYIYGSLLTCVCYINEIIIY